MAAQKYNTFADEEAGNAPSKVSGNTRKVNMRMFDTSVINVITKLIKKGI